MSLIFGAKLIYHPTTHTERGRGGERGGGERERGRKGEGERGRGGERERGREGRGRGRDVHVCMLKYNNNN